MGRDQSYVGRIPSFNRFVRAATQVSKITDLSEYAQEEATRVDARSRRNAPAYGQPAGRQQHAHAHAPQPRHAPQQSEFRVIQHPATYGAPEPDPRQVSSSRRPSQPHPAATGRPTPQSMPARRGQILALFGCRGGAGATSLAIGIGSQLLRAGRSVCIVDMDLQLGDVFVALDLDPQTSLAAVAREAEAIDGAALRRRLAHHNSGLYALTQVGRIDDIDGSLVERMPALMESLAREFDYVIVDGIRDFGDYALSVMDVADQVGLVLTQDVSSVRRAARVITLFRRLGYDATKLALVLNRHARKSQISVQEIERALQMPVTATVRNDYQRVSGAFDEGALLVDVARASGVAKDIATVAGLLAQRAAPGFALLQQQQQGRMPQGYPHQPLNLAAPQKKSFLGGLFKRGGK